MHAERRIYPRIHVKLPAELSSGDGQSVDVSLINLSLGGMLVEGGADLAELKPVITGAPLEVNLHFGLNDQPVHCLCRVVYKQRQSQRCLRYGLSVLSMDLQTQEQLQSYIEQQLH
ncbi:PilZ domain-containing protein [uncultured Neptuniibacter sp.]|uniref:PilZ domain-containing protein n=1 Tax=uncultured Neptuniibacter sp. TaxID=502143 RepID=UPI0026206297|nr:PilZ domain-containing protein [uncultured Neptuniibacter sp.]